MIANQSTKRKNFNKHNKKQFVIYQAAKNNNNNFFLPGKKVLLLTNHAYSKMFCFLKNVLHKERKYFHHATLLINCTIDRLPIEGIVCY